MTVVVEVQDRNLKGSMLISLSCQGPLIKICFFKQDVAAGRGSSRAEVGEWIGPRAVRGGQERLKCVDSLDWPY